MTFPFLGFGVGLRKEHYEFILKNSPPIDWFEVISENYMIPGGRPLFILRQICEKYPVVMHGVSLSIGSTDPLNQDYLKQLKKMADQIQPAWISDHLCWTSVHGNNLHDLLPLPYTEETVRHVVGRIHEVQDFLERPLVMENVSSYLTFKESTMTEWEFLKAVIEESGCSVLLDINNIYVSGTNHGFDPATYIEAIPREKVVQFHLAGHSRLGNFLLDTHDHPVKPKVWRLYERAVHRFGKISTLVEWDENIPNFPVLQKMTEQAKRLC